MAKKIAPDEDPKQQHERFKDVVRKIGANDGKAFARAFGKIVPPAKSKKP